MVAYVAASAASAPPPRGLPLAPAAARGSAVSPVAAGALERLAAGPGENGGVGEDEVVPAVATASPFSDEGPPLEDLEAQMGGEIAAREASSAPVSSPRAARRAAGRSADGEDAGSSGGGKSAPLPELETLVARLPADVRETLEELLRARFIAVKRVPAADIFAPPHP